MTAIELLVRELNSSLEWLKMTLADFSDADLVARPAPAANHPLWQLGHLSCDERWMINEVKSGAIPELPAGFAERFNKKNCGSDDPKQFVASKEQLLSVFARTRAATIAFVNTLKPEDLDKPAPEALRGFCQTVGDVLSIQALHVGWHMGQMQVARRKLGKPVLF